MRSRPELCPDCGQNPPTLHDGSGWFCAECKVYADNISAVIEMNIRERRLKDAGEKADRRRASWRAWYQQNKKRRQAYQKTYNPLYKKGLRDFGMQEALAEAVS